MEQSTSNSPFVQRKKPKASSRKSAASAHAKCSRRRWEPKSPNTLTGFETSMNGLGIAHDFFLNWGKPFLLAEFPELTQRMAVGRFLGSDVIGADDRISQDHNWGPQFSLFLSEDDFHRFGETLSDRMNREAPKKWNGYRVAGAGDKNVLVESIPQWIHRHIGFSERPQDASDWSVIVRDRRGGGTVEARESALYFFRHGALWLDNNAEFRRWRNTLKQYPDPVRYARLAEECFRVWQYGEYNFVYRIAERGDPLAVSMCLGRFSEGVMRMTMLLTGDFTPYWKWLAHEFRKCDSATQLAPMLESLFQSDDTQRQVEIVKRTSHEMYQTMLSMGIITGEGGNKYLLPLLNAQNELMSKIS